MLQSINTNRGEQQKPDETKLDKRLDDLEKTIKGLDKSMDDEDKKRKQRPIPPPPIPPAQPDHIESEVKIPIEKPPAKPTEKKEHVGASSRCEWRESSPSKTTFEIRQLYESLPFNDEDGGVWKQGFDIEYKPTQWSSNDKLKVILMPHSHCDPGWLHTFEGYFNQATKQIIDTVITILDTNKKYKFIWAEMSFLSLWWDQASLDQRRLLKKVVHNKQLEIVTGGWVMNDEANTHYYAMLDQLIEGHQFIENTLGNITVQSGWANDPFGYSPTMAYLLHGTGMQYMAIQRVHYHIKKALAKEKQLEFVWQQTWDRDASTRIFTHVLPFYSYDVPHTCGPDPKVCCQFDFKRAARSTVNCPWGIDPVQITEENVRERAETLLDQYRKKSQLYKTNVVFVQLGDDFRYTTMDEAKNQFENYDRLFTYMNKQSEWNVDAQFGTLSDYFEKLLQQTPQTQFPSYMGDFFTYADRTDHYWSGYFTSRAFFKRMDRIVESYLRASEILFSLANVKMLEENSNKQFPKDDLFKELVKARRNLGVFQHHDGVTGTAKDHVVNDYGLKLQTAITSSQNVMEQSAAYLIYQNNYTSKIDLLLSNIEFKTFESLPTRKVLSLNNQQQPSKSIYVYNPTDQRRTQIVKIVIDTYQVYVTSNKQIIKSCQIDPKWTGRKSNMIEKSLFELLILVDIESYSLKEYTIHTSKTQESCPLTTIEYLNEKEKSMDTSGPFKFELNTQETIQLNNQFLSIKFSKNGTLNNIEYLKTNKKLSFQTNVIHYGTTKQADHNSGAYLFLPDGEAKNIPPGPHDLIRIQRGPLISRVDILHEIYGLQYKLTNINGSDDHVVKLNAITHLNMNNDIELALRFTTGIENGNEFFTDLNGFQTIRRKTYSKLPLQGNVYPMPAMAYIEDAQMRFTIVSGQPSGVASLKSGVVDVFLDRRLLQDDNRGLGQGVTDNREIISSFKLIFEPRHTVDRTSLTGYPTLLAHHHSTELLYPMHILQVMSKLNTQRNELNLFPKSNLFPSDYHLVNLRTLNENRDDSKYGSSKNMALILRRFAYDCDGNYDNLFHFDKPTFEDFFQANQIQSVEQTSLSLRHVQNQLTVTSKIDVPIAEIMTFKLKMK
ncbi:unnamed protein product [Adineta steineri]|uniref:Alpha-mannosidase n=1 Tax=Adineta steineri TaxID=433720 RepID=A0A813R6K4_9BILA|nr:unnamed protein product [Adineta steineri]CAF0828007.1 unnamed protein product [Adineta steineri]